jgi:hypothetical protein
VELRIEGEVMLGRLMTMDGALAEDLGISRNHARLWLAEGSVLMVEDSGSANGTFVNGTRIATTRRLRAGDLLQVGSTVFAVEPRASNAAPLAYAEAANDAPGGERGDERAVNARDGLRPVTEQPTVTETSPPATSRLAMWIELDLDRGEATLAIEDGPAARIVRDGEGWRVSEL